MNRASKFPAIIAYVGDPGVRVFVLTSLMFLAGPLPRLAQLYHRTSSETKRNKVA